ncbi:Cas10/Cmr2 second palm domain-containing protein [Streptomyces collinus]|uniref:Cas10/Cmr2 second palm domain-containing protein n=1 Tax=Streptomyces collinus TaxID=42684 RepID=UPI0036B713D4
MPSVQWVCVPSSVGDYAEQWAVAQEALVARRRVRDFAAVVEPERALCSLSPRWPAETVEPKGLQAHEKDRLAAANWVKRLWHQRVLPGDKDAGTTGSAGRKKAAGFPSTSAVVSGPFRRRALERLHGHREVRNAVVALEGSVAKLRVPRETPLPALRARNMVGGGDAAARWFASSAGRWVYEESWKAETLAREFPGVDATVLDGAVRAGHEALKRLLRRMLTEYTVGPPGAYLAVLAQDLDSMGRFLGGGQWGPGPRIEVGVSAHRDVSQRLSSLAATLRDGLEDSVLMGVPVYAGGDDLLAFAPASKALAAARYAHDVVVDQGDLPSVSTAVLFFHHRSSLQQAVAGAQELLEEAKSAVPERKHVRGVGYLRLSGVRESALQPWVPSGGSVGESGPARGPDRDFGLFLASSTGSGGKERDGQRDDNEQSARGLSLRLVAVLARDAAELSALPEDLYEAEVSRLVYRHGGTAGEAQALLRLGREELGPGPGVARRRPVAATRVAGFLRQECQ